MNRREFADIADEYIRRLNEISEQQGYSIITAFYIEWSDKEPSEYSIDFRHMSMHENLYALGRWNQDIMGVYDDGDDEWGESEIFEK